MAATASKPDRKSDDGFILVAVLWILGGLAVLAAIYALYVVNAATSLEVNNDRLQANASVSAALELTAYYLGTVKPQERPTSGAFNFRVGRSNVAVGFLSEAARIDLNAAQPPLLAGLFRALGVSSDAANIYAERVVGWRSPPVSSNLDTAQSNDKEATAYRNAGLHYNPRQAPFVHVQELWLVLGLPPALIERARNFVTVFSGMPTVNVINAAPEVIAALPGMTPEILDAFLKQRNTLRQDVSSLFQLLGPARAYATVQGSKAIRVTIRVELAKGRRINAEAVILPLEDAPDPYRVLSWQDDFDG